MHKLFLCALANPESLCRSQTTCRSTFQISSAYCTSYWYVDRHSRYDLLDIDPIAFQFLLGVRRPRLVMCRHPIGTLSLSMRKNLMCKKANPKAPQGNTLEAIHFQLIFQCRSAGRQKTSSKSNVFEQGVRKSLFDHKPSPLCIH